MVIAAFINRLWNLTKRVPMTCQNLVADVNAMQTNFRMGWDHYFLLHDTMQANTVLWSPWPDDLNFQASILSDYERTKHLQYTDPEKYNWGDVVHPIEIMEAHFKQFAKDPASWRIYQENVRLLPVIHRSVKSGLRVSDKKVRTAIPMYEERVRESSLIAEAYAGFPFNPGSDDQCKIMLYEVEGLPKQRHPKTRRVTTNKDAVGELRKIYLGEVEDDTPSIENTLEKIEIGGHPILEAMSLYSKASHVLSAYLYPLVEGRNEVG
ncbi:hypothetical protein LCGC14_1378070 [marine sediment metagenome]|uniref:Uncharacterized protein n=1 Tax=marine sediment metagenome TaxID=412755 RepID=A0A0F9N581_9ZZZZ